MDEIECILGNNFYTNYRMDQNSFYKLYGILEEGLRSIFQSGGRNFNEKHIIPLNILLRIASSFLWWIPV